MSLLSIDRINVGYGEIQVLFDLSLNVKEGEVVSIIGANGAGKSTLLKTISGMLKPSSGSVVFADEEIHLLPADEIVSRALIHVPEGRRHNEIVVCLQHHQCVPCIPDHDDTTHRTRDTGLT